MWLIDKVAEQRIAEAVKRGDFDDLPGQGKPIVLPDESHVPESLRVGYRMLKNAGFIPVEMQVRKELASLQHLLSTLDAHNQAYRSKVIKRINYLLVKVGLNSTDSCSATTQSAYFEKLIARVASKDQLDRD